MTATVGTLVDANVLLNVLTEDALAADIDPLLINPLIYAAVSVRFSRIEDLEEALPATHFRRALAPWEAAFLAGKAFVGYRRRGGERTRPLPDFFIGAHAAVEGHRLLTRDARRYRTYFPSVALVAP